MHAGKLVQACVSECEVAFEWYRMYIVCMCIFVHTYGTVQR